MSSRGILRATVMRILANLALLLPVLAAGGFLKRHTHAATISSLTVTVSPATAPTSSSPVATSSAKFESLELRQAPGLASVNAVPVVPTDPATPIPAPANSLTSLANPVNPVIVPSNPHNPAIAPTTPIVPPAAPIAPRIPSVVAPVVRTKRIAITSTLLASPGVTGDFVTTQWVETWIGGTSQTWVPKTITFHFQAMMTHVPQPGKGQIGMGTLTGKTGKTQTVIMGAAPSQAAGWRRGVAAAMGVGIAGMVV